MARQTPIPRFRLEPDSIAERNFSDVRAASASPNIPPLHRHHQQSQEQQPQSPSLQLQIQRSQNRIRRSACSDLQSTAIPEERVYNDNRRRASLFVGRVPPQPTVGIPKLSSCDQEPAEYDYAKLCRLKCQSLYGSLANSNTASSTSPSPLVLSGASFTVVSDDDEDDDDNEDDEDEEVRHFQTPPKNNFRHSLPDTSPGGLAIRNLLKRNKTGNYNNHHPHNNRLGLPTHSSQSLCSSTSSSSNILTNSSSPLSTFRNFLSLVKLPSSASSTKSINSTTTSSSTSMTPHHSSLTTLTSATGGSSTTLDQTTSTISSKKRPTTGIDTQYQWHFEVSTVDTVSC